MRRVACTLILIFAVTVVGGSAYSQDKKGHKAKDLARDPVCGLMVEKNPDLSVTHNGEKYYFCSVTDMNKFKQNPDKYDPKADRYVPKKR